MWSMKTLLLTLTVAFGLTTGVINSQAQISPGPAGMPSSLAVQPEYVFQQTGENFLITNPPRVLQKGTEATDISTTIGNTTVTKHFPEIPTVTSESSHRKVSPEENATRGMAFQEAESLTKGGYNHDGLAFMGWDAKSAAAAAKHEQEKNNNLREQPPIAPAQ
jgi:hypothetical protein